MKFFLDTADVNAIEKWVATGLVDGITTNPSLLAKAGGDPRAQIQKIISLVPDGDVSVEVTETVPDAVYKQAKEIASIAENVVVKIPCHIDYYPTIATLVKEGVALNITLIFSLSQAVMMAKLGVRYVSPFVGRLDDSGADGIALLEEIREVFDNYEFSTQILAASLRSVEHVHSAMLAGADVGTLPIAILQEMVHHSLTDVGIEKFNTDWLKLGITKFP